MSGFRICYILVIPLRHAVLNRSLILSWSFVSQFSFREKILAASPDSSQTMLTGLQRVFAFLMLSQVTLMFFGVNAAFDALFMGYCLISLWDIGGPVKTVLEFNLVILFPSV